MIDYPINTPRSVGLPNSSSLISFCFVAFSVASVLSMARLLWTASFSAELRAQPMLKLFFLCFFLCLSPSLIAQPVNWRNSSLSDLQNAFLFHTLRSDQPIYFNFCLYTSKIASIITIYSLYYTAFVLALDLYKSGDLHFSHF